VAWSWSTPVPNTPDLGITYHSYNAVHTLSLNTEYVFSMTFVQEGLYYAVKTTSGTVVWSITQNVGSGSHFMIANFVHYPYFNYGQGIDVPGLTDYVECWYMESTIRSPAFNLEFLGTSTDSSYVNTWTTLYLVDTARNPSLKVPEWMHINTAANGNVEIWCGFNKITDFGDSTLTSIGSSIRLEDSSVWLAWSGNSNHYLNVISTPDMKTWGTKTTITSQTSPYGPSLIWDHLYGGIGHSQLVMAWVGTGSSNYINTMRSTDGVTWTDHWTGTSLPKSDRSPSLACDYYDNILYLAYKATTTHIVILSSINDGFSWSTVATLSLTTSDAPAIAWTGVSPNSPGRLYLAFGSVASFPNINVMQSTNGGVTWTNQKTLPDQMAAGSSTALGLTCTGDGLTISWYDKYLTGMVSFRRSAGADTRFWGEKVSLPFGSFSGAATVCGSVDRYIAWSSGSSNNINLLKVIWDPQSQYGTVDGFFDGFEDSAAFSQNWVAIYGTPHTSTALHHRGVYSYATSSDREVIKHSVPGSNNLPGLTGRLEIWMYDPGPSIYEKVQIIACQDYPSSLGCCLGIMSMYYPHEYVYRYDGTTYYDTGVARTQGWHCLQIVVDGTNTIGYIDGVRVFTLSWLSFVSYYTIGDYWLDSHIASAVAFDDVSFSTSYV